jgi:hypothetical protein
MGGVLMDNTHITPEVVRAATYLEAMQRSDAPFQRSGKTRKGAKCTPGNKKCGDRCIPVRWRCRITGGGLDSHSKAVQFDPVSGTNNLVRGTRNVIEGTQKGDPEKITRGIKGIERGIVKLTPGQTKDEKELFRKRVKAVGTVAFTALLSGIALHRTHRTLNRFDWYRNGIGQQIDGSARRAVDRVFDAGVGRLGWNSMRTNRIQIRTRAAQQANRLRRQSDFFRQTQQELRGPLRNRTYIAQRATMMERNVGINATKLRAIDARARSEGWNQVRFEAEKARALYSLRTGGLRGDLHSAFSQPAAHEYLARQWGFNTRLNSLRATGEAEIFNTRELLRTAISETHRDLTADMARRGIRNTPTGIRRYVDELIREDDTIIGTGLTAPQRAQVRREFTEQMTNILNASDRARQSRLASETYNNAVAMYDDYFSRIADSLSLNDEGSRIISALRPDSAAGVADYGLARFHFSEGSLPVRPTNPTNAVFLNNYYYHTRIRPINRGPQGNKAYPFASSQQALSVAQSFDRRISTVDEAQEWFRSRNLDVYIPTRRELFRPDSAEDLGLPVRVQSYLQTRYDAPPRTGGTDKGKPCGKSFIPKNEKCKKPIATRLAQAALIAGGVAGTAYLLKRAKLGEFHTGVMTGEAFEANYIRKRRFSYMKKNQARTGTDDIVAAYEDLKSHPSVNRANVEAFQKFVKDEGIYSDASTFMKDFEDSLKPHFSTHEIDLMKKELGLSVNLGILDGLAVKANSKNVFVRSIRKDKSTLRTDADSLVNTTDAFMNLRKANQRDSFSPTDPDFYRLFQVSNNTVNGDAKEASLFIHEIAHKAHFKASRNKKIGIFEDRLYDPISDIKSVAGKNSDKTLQELKQISSAYGLTDINERRAETFAELSILYMTNGKRFQQEYPLAYSWVDTIWKEANG